MIDAFVVSILITRQPFPAETLIQKSLDNKIGRAKEAKRSIVLCLLLGQNAGFIGVLMARRKNYTQLFALLAHHFIGKSRMRIRPFENGRDTQARCGLQGPQRAEGQV